MKKRLSLLRPNGTQMVGPCPAADPYSPTPLEHCLSALEVIYRNFDLPSDDPLMMHPVHAHAQAALLACGYKITGITPA